MGEVSLETSAYAKIILHAAKYPHCAVNGVLLADGSKLKSGNKNQDLDIVDSIPLFHHSHYVTPMAEIALTQIELQAQSDNRVIAGYYAACENFRDNTVEKCPGQKIAEKIVEYFPSAVFIVPIIAASPRRRLLGGFPMCIMAVTDDVPDVDNKRMMLHLDTPAIKIHKYSEGKWKPKDANKVLFQSQYVLETVSHLLQRKVHKDLVDFDNYLDDSTQDWNNLGIEKLIASIDASNSIDKEKDSD